MVHFYPCLARDKYGAILYVWYTLKSPWESIENALTGYHLSSKIIALGPDSGSGRTACECTKCYWTVHFIFIFLDRRREWEGGGGEGKGERENLKQTPCSVWSPVWSWISWLLRSWPEPKFSQMLNWLSHPGALWVVHFKIAKMVSFMLYKFSPSTALSRMHM